jgi:hypothetical protein
MAVAAAVASIKSLYIGGLPETFRTTFFIFGGYVRAGLNLIAIQNRY